jgi:hypothetical protein
MAEREAGMMISTGAQGVGKTFQNMHVVVAYVKDKFYNKVKGRKCLIFDTNGEYTKSQFQRNDIDNFDPKRIALSDVGAWSRTDVKECRRIDAKSLSIREKKEAIEYIVKNYRNGMLVLEDINTYILNMTNMEDIVSGLVNLRHRAVDVMVSYQSLRPVEPRMWQNCRWIRFHYQVDNVNDIKGKVSNPELMKLAQIIVNKRYHGGDKRFFLYVHNLGQKIEGKFTKSEFEQACRDFLNQTPKKVREYKATHKVSVEEATKGCVQELTQLYYGN